MGEPSERKLQSLPMWAREWIQTLKYRVMQRLAKESGRVADFTGRRMVREPLAESVFHLPFWAQDWIDLLMAESDSKATGFVWSRTRGEGSKEFQGGLFDVGTEQEAGREDSRR